MSVCVCMCVYVCVCVCVCMCMCMCMCVCMCVYVCVYVCIYVCVCVYVLYNICIDKPAHLNRLLFVKLKQNINKYQDGNGVWSPDSGRK